MELPEWLKSNIEPGDSAPVEDAAAPDPAPPADPQPQPGPGRDAAEPEPGPEPEPSEAPPRGAAGAAPVGDEVLGMLAQIEQRLQGLTGEAPDAALQRKLDEAQAEIEELVRQAEVAQRELDDKTKSLEELETRVAELDQAPAEAQAPDDDETDGREQAELRLKVDELTGKLRDRDERIAELEGRLAQGGGAAAAAPSGGSEVIARQRQQIERLTEQLAVLNTDADPKEIRERDARIAELEETLEQHRAGRQGVGKLVAGALRRGRKSDGGHAELEARVEELNQECERLRSAAARAEAGAARAEPGNGGDAGAAAENAKLREQVEALESRLEAVADGDDSAATAPLQDRIRRLERELKEAKTAGTGERMQQAQQLRDQWQQLRQEREALVHSERTMRDRWARQQSIVMYGWLVGVAVIGLIFSALAAHKLLPPTVAATVRIEAEKRLGGAVSREEAERWQARHHDMLEDESLLDDVATRLGAQRLDEYKRGEALSERLREDLTVDAPEPGALTLTLAGTDRHAMLTILDTLASTMARESSHEVGQRSDGAIAVVRGERREGGRIRYATTSGTPISDRRLPGGAVIFVIVFAGSLFAVRKLRAVMARTKLVLEEDPYDAVAME